ncbi:hypothetical protein ACSBR1_013800 [Camellia fascicularis]
MRDCPKLTNPIASPSGPVRKPARPGGERKDQKHQRRAFALVLGKSKVTENVVLGTLSVCGHLAHVLIDSDSTHYFVVPHFAAKLASTPEPLGYILSVSFPSGNSVYSTDVYRSCTISLKDKTLYVDLITLRIGDFDVILGMDWLAANHASIDCKAKKVSLRLPNQPELVFDRTGVSNPPYIISSMTAQRLLRKGCGSCICYVIDTQKKAPTVDAIPVVQEFPDVFPENLPGTPVDQEIEFVIETQPGIQPVSKAPYRMSMTELKELKTQLQELLDKGFIRPTENCKDVMLENLFVISQWYFQSLQFASLKSHKLDKDMLIFTDFYLC